MTKKWWIFLLRVIIFHRKSPPYKTPSERRYRARREKPVTESRGISTAFQAEMVEIAYMPDTSCPVTLVSLGIALQASDIIPPPHTLQTPCSFLLVLEL